LNFIEGLARDRIRNPHAKLAHNVRALVFVHVQISNEKSLIIIIRDVVQLLPRVSMMMILTVLLLLMTTMTFYEIEPSSSSSSSSSEETERRIR
jgi:hypothetical protein